MQIILECTRNTAMAAMHNLLGMSTIGFRWQKCQAIANLHMRANAGHLLHVDLWITKGTRLKSGKSWLGQAETVVQCACVLDVAMPSEEWTSFGANITLSRVCVQENPMGYYFRDAFIEQQHLL